MDTSRSTLNICLQVQDDARRIFDTGYFHYVDWDTEDTRDGVKLTLQVSEGGAGSGGKQGDGARWKGKERWRAAISLSSGLRKGRGVLAE